MGVVVVSSPGATQALEHAGVTFTSVFRGNPPPTITWEREGSEDLPVVTRREITAIPVRNESVTLYTVSGSLSGGGALLISCNRSILVEKRSSYINRAIEVL